MITNARTAELGGIAQAAAPDTVPLYSRRYTHPALPGRAVVRLVRDSLQEVEDLSLAVLGFNADGGAEVGHVRMRAIGFPAWPILTDPDNARHALNLVGDLRRADKLAKSKAGPAKELLDELAGRLGQAAPHFLPTFLEEGARIFLRHDNPSYATQFFGKAREAERTHNVPIDEQRHHLALLEFALAGALSAKELTNESKALLNRHSPKDALEMFFTLTIDRIRGGLPPHATLAADLKRLVKAAGADQKEVDERLLTAIIDSPALSKAPGGFWKSYLKPLTRLAMTHSGVRAKLAAMTPGSVQAGPWIETLEATGVADELRSGKHDAVDWAQRMCKQVLDNWNAEYLHELAEFIRRLTALRGAKVTLNVPGWVLEPDILDALIEVGAELDLPGLTSHRKLRFGHWVMDDRRSDLRHLAASPFADAAISGIGDLDFEDHLPELLTHDGTRRLLHTWVRPRLTAESTAVDFTHELERLLPVYSTEGLAEFQDELDEFESRADLALILANTLREGLLVELGWPALEEAIAEFGTDPITFHLCWPAIGVASGLRVIWVEGENRVGDVTLHIPGGKGSAHVRWLRVQGQTCCIHRDASYDLYLTWESDPTNHLALDRSWYAFQDDTVHFEVPGGRLLGAGLLRPGDRTLSVEGIESMLSDGTHFWIAEKHIKEVDPATGKVGRESLPSGLANLVEQHLRDDWQLDHDSVVWYPAVPGSEGSPLPTAGGMHGWASLHRGDQSLRVFVDGTNWTPPGLHARVAARRPGGGLWGLNANGNLLSHTTGASIAASLTRDSEAHPLHFLPLAGWHYLRPRDEPASVRLRALEPHLAARILEVTEDEITDAARIQVANLIGTTAEPLVEAVCQIALLVNTSGAALKQVREAAEAPQDAGTFTEWEPSADAVSWIRSNCDAATRRAGYRYLARHITDSPAPEAAIQPSVWIGLAYPELYLAGATRPFSTRDEIGGAAATIGAIRDQGLHRPGARLFTIAQDYDHRLDIDDGALIQTSVGNVLALTSNYSFGEGFPLLCLSLDGAMPESVDDHAVQTFAEASNVDLDRVIQAFELLLEQGPPAWVPERAERLAAGTGWPLPAAKVFLAQMPNMRYYVHNWLPKAIRELLGLKVAEAQVARNFLTAIDDDVLLKLMLAGCHEPLTLARDGVDVDAIVAAWKRLSQDRFEFPGEVLQQIDRAFAWDGSLGLRNLAETPHIDDMRQLLWLAYSLPLDADLRAWAAGRFPALRDAAFNRPLMSHFYDHSERQAVRVALGLPAFDLPPQNQVDQFDAWRLTATPWHDVLEFYPDQVRSWDLEEGRAAALPADSLGVEIGLLCALQRGDFEPIEAALATPGEGWAQDPLRSAPEAVASVREQLGLDEDAARYWLQLLALPDPKDANIHRWNGWTRAKRLKAAAPLIEQGLVVEAKRSRAGRSLFLPGGWLEASAPHLPLEVWKAPFFDLYDEPKVKPRLGVVVPQVPLTRLFADAWQRYRDGDIPGYTELRTERYRRR